MSGNIAIYIAIMAVVTYLIRSLPLIIFRKKIESQFFQSFLHYVPYAVLGAMTFPAALYSTGDMLSAVCSTAAAILLALKSKPLIVVALAAAAVAYAVMLIEAAVI